MVASPLSACGCTVQTSSPCSKAPKPIVAGATASFTISFSSATNYLGNVGLSVTNGLPAGATATFSPLTVSAANPTSTLSVLTPGTLAPGAYPITITATDGATTHSTVALLIVNTINAACIENLGNNWVSGNIPPQTGTFTAQWDATPSTALNNSNVGLSLGPQTAFTGLAIAGRFNPTGQIDARKGGAFPRPAPSTTPRASTITSAPSSTSPPAPTPSTSIYVTPAGGTEIPVGLNYAFRSEQTGVKTLNYWDAISQVGTISLCNLVVDTAPTQGTVQLTTTATLAPLSDGSYDAVVMVKNTGTGTAQAVQLTAATLGTATGAPLPAALGDIQPGGTALTTINFPASAGAPGAAVIERYTGTYTGGSFGGSIRATLPNVN